jgi:hypothetical protein
MTDEIMDALAPIPTDGKEGAKNASVDEAMILVKKANAAAARLEEANKKMEEILLKQEKLFVERSLGGKTEAGKPAMTEEEKETAEVKKMLDGTGLEL